MGAVQSLGTYPKNYNAQVHGPFVPWRNYGPIDKPFSQVRLIDLPAWIGRRDKSAEGVLRGASRLAHKWHFKVSEGEVFCVRARAYKRDFARRQLNIIIPLDGNC